MVSMASILFCIERFQNLISKETKLSIISFALACALATLHYWTGRFVVICLMLFYLINFEELNILKIKTYLKITSYKKIKTILLIFMCMTFILILFYPGNIFLLFLHLNFCIHLLEKKYFRTQVIFFMVIQTIF